MSQPSQITDDRSRISSILLLDKDKLLQSIFRLNSLLTTPSNVNEILVKILDEVVDEVPQDGGGETQGAGGYAPRISQYSRQIEKDAQPVSCDRRGGRAQHEHPDSGRKRHREGTDRPGDPPAEQPEHQTLCRCQLRRDSRYYVEEFNRKFKKKVTGFTEDAERILTAYPWPGNVRELKNIIERIMILHNDGFQITCENLPAEMRITTNQEKLRLQIDNILPQLSPEGIDFTRVMERITNDIKRKIIENTLAASRGNKTEAARCLGISRYKLIREQKKINNDIK